MENTGKNHQKHLSMATIREAVESGSGTKSEVMSIIADFDENYYGGGQVLNSMIRSAGYTRSEYERWLQYQN